MLVIPRRRLFAQLAAGTAVLAAPAVVRAQPRRWRVAIGGFAFTPPALEVRQGDGVVWTNDDIVPHTATALDGSWDTGALEQGDSAELVLEQPGTVDYLCTFHPAMRASVTVLA